MAKKTIRGINFADRFKESCLYKELYLQHQDELFIGIRIGYLNIYYNNINIAEVSYLNNGEIRCKINEYYFTGKSNSKVVTFTSEEDVRKNIVEKYDVIKMNSDKKKNLEKKSQAMLFIKNNANPCSEWYCTDVEWRRPMDREHPDFNGRFDIIAVSKTAPHRIAIIELKYNKISIGDESGVNKHIEDFYKFKRYKYYDTFKMETISILRNRKMLDPMFPEELKSVRMEDFAIAPEFYVITLDNNAESANGSTPKQTMGGYLFNDKTKWNSPKVSKNTVESLYGDVTDENNLKVHVNFRFSPVTLEELSLMETIDIINDDIYKLEAAISSQDGRIKRTETTGLHKKSSAFQEVERIRQTKLLEENSKVFYGAKSGGVFAGKERLFCLAKGDEKKNLYQPMVEDCIRYFENNNIVFWGSEHVPNHVLSSQVSCLNHLFAVRRDKDVVLRIAKMMAGEDVVNVLPMACDKEETYISFEVTSKYDHLNERTTQRGANCTSVDAAILGLLADGRSLLIPIEWKYTEGNEYNVDRSGTEGSGAVRLRRYTELINSSEQLKTKEGGYLSTIYFVEPFYQLMRQTLWSEQVVAHKQAEVLKADTYLHVHVIPSSNEKLLYRKYRYSDKGLEESWREVLLDQNKYKKVNPELIVNAIKSTGKYSDLVEYLSIRYGYELL